MKTHRIVATALGSGYSPWAPGTAGSAVGIVLLYAIHYAVSTMWPIGQGIWLVINSILIVVFGLWGVDATAKVHQYWPHDDNRIVIDEVVGVWIAALMLPLHWSYYLAAFVVFRLFDIFKPFGIKKIDKYWQNEWGVMMDDVLAGLYACVSVHLFIYAMNIL